MKKLKSINLKKVILIYLVLYVIATCLYCGIQGSQPSGEWDDYVFPVAALLDGGRIGLTMDDLPVLKEYFPQWEGGIDALGLGQMSGKINKNGEMLTWYFPTYALVNLPMIGLLRFMKLPATYAFCFTNLLSVFALLFAVAVWLKASDKVKLALVVLLSINPVIFYYAWPSAETLLYSLLGLAMVCWYNKWYKRAAIFVSIAGTMNPVIMSVGIVMIIGYLVRLLASKTKEVSWLQFIKKNILSVIAYGACYIIGLIPMGYFYYHTGHINLTASHAGFLNGRENTFQRMLAYLFDPNFGILPYFPVLVVLGGVLLVLAVIRKNWRYMEWIASFLAVVAMYSVMVHINSGMSGIARYNVWGAVILIFAVCLFADELIKKKRNKGIVKGFLALNAVAVLLIVYHYGPTNASNTSYTSWTPIGAYVMDHFPTLYNPLHSTFNSRTSHVDGGYDFRTPVIYTGSDGYVRKVLATKDDAEKLKTALLSNEKQDWLDRQIEKLDSEPGYISIPARYRVAYCSSYMLGTPLYFNAESYNVDKYVASGLSGREDWGTWTDGKEFTMRLVTGSTDAQLRCYLEAGVFNGSQRYEVYVNDQKVTEGIFAGGSLEFNFPNPGRNKRIEMRIELPDAVSPNQVDGSSDYRVLGIGLQKMMFTRV